MKQHVQTPNAPGAPAFLSQAIIANGFVFVSGQIHNTTEGTLIEGSVAEKMAQIMQNITSILVAAGSSLKDAVKVAIYVTNMAQMPELNQVYPTYFTEPYPAREAVCVAALPLGATIEVSVIATC